MIGTPHALFLLTGAENNAPGRSRWRRRAMKVHTVRMAILAVVAAVTMGGPAFAGRTQAEREMASGKSVTTESVTTRTCKCGASPSRDPARPAINPSTDPGRVPGSN